MSIATLITAEEFGRMSFDTPAELIRGEVVTMSPPGLRHGAICSNVCGLLWLWNRDQGDAWIVTSNDAGVLVQREPDTVRGPDVFVVRRERLPNGRVVDGIVPVSPELAVEVVSPSDRWTAVVAKIGQLLSAGVLEVWVLNPPTRQVHVYRPDDEPTVLDKSEILSSQALPGFKTAVAEFFRGI
jgi:Uma2 family endonuclease